MISFPDEDRPRTPRLRGWNVVATALEGQRGLLIGALRRLGRFGGGGYRNIVVGVVEDRAAFLSQVAENLTADRQLAASLARVVPIDVVVRLDPDDPTPGLLEASAPFLDALAEGPFYVRVERRGFRGRIDSTALERDLGTRVWNALAARGVEPSVEFRDPAHVLSVQTLGDQAGLALLSRATRTAYPFVRVS
jgi:tRNA(Ser,Leu) C12 N-acetylase TAN1